MTDVDDAKKIIDAENERVREADRRVVSPRHFHATVFTYVTKDANGNFVDSTHHEVMGMTVEDCIRKAQSRGERRHEGYHLAQLSECTEPGHSTGLVAPSGGRPGRN